MIIRDYFGGSKLVVIFNKFSQFFENLYSSFSLYYNTVSIKRALWLAETACLSENRVRVDDGKLPFKFLLRNFDKFDPKLPLWLRET